MSRLWALAIGVFLLSVGCAPRQAPSAGGRLEALEAKLRSAERRIRSLEANVYPGFKNNKEYVCDCILQEIKMALDEYRSERGTWPPSGNVSLVRELSRKNHHSLPYLEFTPEMLNERGEVLDPWGLPYIYRFNPEGPRRPECELYSCGKNGEDDSGTGDDLTSW